MGLNNFSRFVENYNIITKISILKVEDSLTRWCSNVIFRSVTCDIKIEQVWTRVGVWTRRRSSLFENNAF